MAGHSGRFMPSPEIRCDWEGAHVEWKPAWAGHCKSLKKIINNSKKLMTREVYYIGYVHLDLQLRIKWDDIVYISHSGI